jgi:hypothetical protein
MPQIHLIEIDLWCPATPICNLNGRQRDGLIQFFTEKIQSCDGIGNGLPFISSALMILRQLLDASVDSSSRRLNEHGQAQGIRLDDRGFIEALPAIQPCHSKTPGVSPSRHRRKFVPDGLGQFIVLTVFGNLARRSETGMRQTTPRAPRNAIFVLFGLTVCEGSAGLRPTILRLLLSP